MSDKNDKTSQRGEQYDEHAFEGVCWLYRDDRPCEPVSTNTCPWVEHCMASYAMKELVDKMSECVRSDKTDEEKQIEMDKIMFSH